MLLQIAKVGKSIYNFEEQLDEKRFLILF